MTSLTTLTATSSLMHLSAAEPHAPHAPVSDTTKPPCFATSPVKLLAAIASFVICVSLLGGVAVGLTTPTTVALANADAAESV